MKNLIIILNVCLASMTAFAASKHKDDLRALVLIRTHLAKALNGSNQNIELSIKKIGFEVTQTRFISPAPR